MVLAPTANRASGQHGAPSLGRDPAQSCSALLCRLWITEWPQVSLNGPRCVVPGVMVHFCSARGGCTMGADILATNGARNVHPIMRAGSEFIPATATAAVATAKQGANGRVASARVGPASGAPAHLGLRRSGTASGVLPQKSLPPDACLAAEAGPGDTVPI